MLWDPKEMMLGRQEMLFRVEGRPIWVRNFGQQEGAVCLRHRKDEAREAAAGKE